MTSRAGKLLQILKLCRNKSKLAGGKYKTKVYSGGEVCIWVGSIKEVSNFPPSSNKHTQKRNFAQTRDWRLPHDWGSLMGKVLTALYCYCKLLNNAPQQGIKTNKSGNIANHFDTNQYIFNRPGVAGAVLQTPL